MAETSVARKWWPGRRLPEWFDWLDSMEWPALATLRDADHMLRIEEKRDDDTLVIRAEMPGIDPEKDVDIKLRDHTLEIRAERREEKTTEEKGTHRSEFRYGSFFRAIPIPPESKEGDVRASYADGILEIRVPCAPAAQPATQQIPVARK